MSEKVEDQEIKCPHCLISEGKQISFLRIEDVGKPNEKAFFGCCRCQKVFIVSGLREEYLPNLIARLKDKYPLKHPFIKAKKKTV